ncbi:MAG: helix-turn-helix domain-containing protein, partial [Clostridia bacterium]|nr:helix-turn-helix domain-containing protein [Clostridia bacterium]
MKKMSGNETPPVRRKIIGNRLRELREASGMSVEEVAGLMGVSRAAAYRQETGYTSVSVADAEKYFRIYGVEDTPIAEHIMTLVIGDKNGRWKKIPKSLKDSGSQIEMAELEDVADLIFGYEPLIIPGLLQSSEYIQALLQAPHGVERFSGDIDATARLRERRQEILHRKDRPSMTFILTEAALRYRGGPSQTMKDQACHLINLIRVHGVEVRLLPFSTGFIAGMSRPTMIVEIGKSNPVRVAYYDLLNYGQLVEDESTIVRVMGKFRRVSEVSHSSEKTAQILENYY